MKVCSKCKGEKPLACFQIRKIGKNGIDSICKNCKNTWLRTWAKKNKDKIKKYKTKVDKEKVKKYKDKNREKINKQTNISYHKAAQNLSTSYLKQAIKQRGFTLEQVNKHPEILETLKVIVKTKRLCKTLQN